ncbi:MAG: helix-turn-helix domain-containing protein [Alphaproteobacteria bacterium]
MTPDVFTTVGLPKEKQLDAWRGWYDTIFDVVPDDPQQGFSATSKTWKLGGFGLTCVRAPRLRAFRTAALIRRNPIDHWIITIGRQRTFGEVGQEQSIDVPAGVPFVASLGRPLASLRDADRRLQLFLPRDGFPALAAVLDGAEGRPLGSPMGKLLADFLTLLARESASLSEVNLSGLQSAVQGMVLACIAPSQDHGAPGPAAIAVTRRETVRRIVDANLRNASLQAEFLCREAGMSRSQLYRLLESEGGVESYIQRRRLKQGLAELSDPANRRSVSAIATALCFADPSSFSRAFKKEFGLSPTEMRQAALSGVPVSFPHANGSNSEGHSLRHLLGQFARG